MSYLSDSINILASNVLGGTDVSMSFRKSPIERRDNSPLSTLEGDPYAFSSISYPRDVTQDMQNGHYMLFYINVQNKTKYRYTSAETGLPVNQKTMSNVSKVDAEQGFATSVPTITTHSDTDASYRTANLLKGGKGTILGTDGATLKKGRKAMTGLVV